MSHTLLMRMIGPMQSWGVGSDFVHRDTSLEPTKSGVIGLLCAALGKPRDENHPDNLGKPPLATLAQLRMGVRVDREGVLMKDYHTALKVREAKAKTMENVKKAEVSIRNYLSDAAFLVGLESQSLELLQQLEKALHHPRWFLYLGRKAFTPSEPIWVKGGLRNNMALEEALSIFPRLRFSRDNDERTRLLIEVGPGEFGEFNQNDQPVSFTKGQRRFTARRMRMSVCIPSAGG